MIFIVLYNVTERYSRSKSDNKESIGPECGYDFNRFVVSTNIIFSLSACDLLKVLKVYRKMLSAIEIALCVQLISIIEIHEMIRYFFFCTNLALCNLVHAQIELFFQFFQRP